MTGQEIIKDKINHFYNQQCKVHLVKVPNPKYPKGKFFNGIIGQVYDDFILLNDDLEGMIEIFISEIADMERFKEKNNA